MKYNVKIRKDECCEEIAAPKEVKEGGLSLWQARLEIPLSKEMLSSIKVNEKLDVKLSGKVVKIVSSSTEDRDFDHDSMTFQLSSVEFDTANEFTELAEGD